MKKWNIPLTYAPKIQPVIDGTCRQTIRTGRKFSVGDLIRFYTWAGRPYHSKRTTVTEYAEITSVKNCRISKDGIDDMQFQGEFGLWDWNELDTLAELDGIVPPTGETLRDVLMSKNRLTSDWVDAQIVRW
jgi:hypothetical protein